MDKEFCLTKEPEKEYLEDSLKSLFDMESMK